MNKTRLLALLLALVMTVTLFVGCGKEQTGEPQNTNSQTTDQTSKTEEYKETNIEVDTTDKGYVTTKEMFVTKMKDLVDISLYEELDENTVGSSNVYSYYIKSESKKEYALDYKVKLGDGSEFIMPITFSDLQKLGWILPENPSNEQEMGSSMMTVGNVKNAGGKTLHVNAYNPTANKIPFKDCTVLMVEAEQFNSDLEKMDDAIDFTVCDILTNASTLEDIIQKLGAPSAVNCTLRHDDNGNYTESKIEVTYQQKSSAYSSIRFTLSGDGNFITNMKYEVAPQ